MCYLYEVSVYRILRDRAECLRSFFIRSKDKLKIKKEIIDKKTNNGIIEKSIVLLEEPF